MGWLRLPAFALALLAMLVAASPALACDGQVAVCPGGSDGAVGLVVRGQPTAVYVDSAADSAVRRVAGDFAKDLGRVSGTDAEVLSDARLLRGEAVVIGVVGESPVIDDLIERGLIDPSAIAGQWEVYLQAVVENPWPNVGRALLIVGSDRRGAVYGTYDISEKMGVSPWYWWADVPVPRQVNLFVTPGARHDQPKVKYRGFFINDEDPAFSGWAKKQFGGINAPLYEHVFELLLRLKGNYLWPAMWGKAFNEDDPRNTALADAMGVVMGTSHHEPLTRAQAEWDGKTMGAWNYATNAEALRTFWRGGIERMVTRCGDHPCDSLVTVGMRGDGDEPMSEGTAIGLLETIVKDQRAIIADVTGKPAEATPQVWALYKEVQDYYDKGMRVPDDVILLFADDNWGQIRRLPPEDAAPRKGGYGVYYHFDYVGGPRSYRWLNTVQVGKVWQQLDLAWQRGVRDLWIVNVGDIKPMEIPLSFFMEQAWDPEAMNLEGAFHWTDDWVERTFGPGTAVGITGLLDRSERLAALRKPELVDAASFPLGEGIGDQLDGGEFGELVAQWQSLREDSAAEMAQFQSEFRPAYFELAGHRIEAMSNLYEMYYAQAWNQRLAAAGDVRANYFADRVEKAFAKDKDITRQYHALLGGKWDGMMSQSHIGYTNWAAPPEDVMPPVERVATDLAADEIAGRVHFGAGRASPDANVGIDASSSDNYSEDTPIRWLEAPFGRTKNAIVAYPQGEPATSVDDGITIAYDVNLAGGPTGVALFLSPTLDTQARGGLSVGISLDDRPVQILTSTLEPTAGAPENQDQADWERAVENNNHTLIADFGEVAAGRHTLRIWRIDDNVVIQRIGIGPDPTGGRYLGPPAR